MKLTLVAAARFTCLLLLLSACGSPAEEGAAAGERTVSAGGAGAGGAGAREGVGAGSHRLGTGPNGSTSPAPPAGAAPPGAITPSTPTTPTTSPLPSVVNAVSLANYSALYRGAGGTAISFWNSANTSAVVRAYDEHASILWEKNLGVGSLKSGFDLDGDGVVDFALVSAVAHSSCNAETLYLRTARVHSGKNGALLTSVSLVDECKSLTSGTTQASITLAENTLQYGSFSGLLTIAPRYTSQGYFFQWGASLASFPFYPPNTSAYETYSAKTQAALPVGSQAFVPDSQPLNGLLLPDASTGAPRYVAATSGRFVRYAFSPLGPSQLISDVPFLGSSHGAGRSYGLLQHDRAGNRSNVTIVAGTSVASLYQDLVQGNASGVVTGFDRWGGIERHVSRYDMASNAVAQTYHSYAHDDANHDAYVGRVAFPSSTLLPSPSAAGSSLIYNLFDGQRWNAIITAPGGVAAATTWPDRVVWDVIDRGNDEVDVLTSPVDTARSVMIPDYLNDAAVVQSWRAAKYFPQFKIEVFRWSRTAPSMALVRTIVDAVPYLGVPFSSPPHIATSEAAHFQTVRTMDASTHSKPVLVVRRATGAIAEVAYDW